jgi:hypothetical protein
MPKTGAPEFIAKSQGQALPEMPTISLLRILMEEALKM